jgi:uncharacterized protein (DUF1015 family)
MAVLTPFRALRPALDVASRVASVPYDVVDTAEARVMTRGEPLSFLRVTRSEVDLPDSISAYDESVYARAAANLKDLIATAPLIVDDAPTLFFYRQQMGAHVQTGLAGCFSIDEYERDLIKKHERTRPDKEDDRTRHIVAVRAQTGIVFLTYRASVTVDDLATRACSGTPLYDFTSPDGIQHTVWPVSSDDVAALVRAFAGVPALYIADGHHRAASAARARGALRSLGHVSADADVFVAVAFPDTQLKILPYHRVVKDLNGHTPETLLASLRTRVAVTDGRPTPTRPDEVSMFLARQWYGMTLPGSPSGTSRACAGRRRRSDRQTY